MSTSGRSNERGAALMMTLVLAFLVTGIAIGMILMTGNGTIVSRFHTTQAVMEAAADAGIEQARDTVNGSPGIVPGVGGFDTLELNVPVRDANGLVIPGFTRSTYVGLSGNISGQFGTFASAISVIQNPRGAVVVRRGELAQESFAKFARFDNRTTSGVRFASGIQVFGPLHTNQTLYVDNGGGAPTFHGPVTTAATISVAAEGIFKKGYKENIAVIPMPSPAELATLDGYATGAGMHINGGTLGTGVYDPDTRIEFVPVDINLDGDFRDENEGFFRVWKASGARSERYDYVSARSWPIAAAGTSGTDDPNMISANCGGIWTAAQGGNDRFYTADSIWNKRGGSTANRSAAVRAAFTGGAQRCYLGGDQRLYPTYYTTAAPASFFIQNNVFGAWQIWAGWGAVANPQVAAGRLSDGRIVGAAMARYLWPATREFNINFKGVIYVNGSVAVSGVLRGQVTVATTGNVMLADDLTYVTAPGNDPDCEADVLGVLTPQFFMLEDNNVNSPFRVAAAYRTGFDDSGAESLNGAVLTLKSILSEDVSGGSTNSETCVGNPVGRGCFNMVGSAIQEMNGPRMSSSGDRLEPAVELRPLHGDRAAAVLPDDGPLLHEPALRDRPGRLQPDHLVRDPPERPVEVADPDMHTVQPAGGWTVLLCELQRSETEDVAHDELAVAPGVLDEEPVGVVAACDDAGQVDPRDRRGHRGLIVRRDARGRIHRHPQATQQRGIRVVPGHRQHGVRRAGTPPPPSRPRRSPPRSA